MKLRFLFLFSYSVDIGMVDKMNSFFPGFFFFRSFPNKAESKRIRLSLTVLNIDYAFPEEPYILSQIEVVRGR